MKILSVVGARPQFVKAAAVSRKMRVRHQEILVHTGQHYDYGLSGVFFDGLEIPKPDVNLEVGSGSHAAQTGAMLVGLENLIREHRPDWLLIYGDTNSTLAGAMAAAKLNVPVAHVEAGLRSFNRRMPEEVNRVIADHVSSLLLCPSDTAVANLAAEGILEDVHLVGDVMLDVLQWARRRVDARPAILDRLGLTRKRYLLATVHRAENTDDGGRLSRIVRALNAIEEPVVFPVHPRTRKMLAEDGVRLNPHVMMIDPVGYLDMIALTSGARLVLTDSGGLQKEAYWLRVPCLSLRDETEWVETVATGWNVLVGSNDELIVLCARSFVRPESHPTLYGDGSAAERCVELMEGVTNRTHRLARARRQAAMDYHEDFHSGIAQSVVRSAVYGEDAGSTPAP